ncbi:MAG: hypothetical protein ABR903_04075 [Thermodesulfovibrionales bacterium]
MKFALPYPEAVTHLILENPIGLEDYRDFVPYTPIEHLYANELKMTEEAICYYHKAHYAEWKPGDEEYVQVFVRWRLSRARISEACNGIFTHFANDL